MPVKKAASVIGKTFMFVSALIGLLIVGGVAFHFAHIQSHLLWASLLH